MWPFKPQPYGIIDWIKGLKLLPAGSIDSVVTSPPYWNLRDYGVDGQLGLEATMGEYIKNLCDGFDQVHRVLKDTGTCWVNLGDTYNGSGGSGDPRYKKDVQLPKKWREVHRGYPRKSLCLIPERFAIEMVDRGWVLRNVIIWHKRNCMPSSVKDRFTLDFEQIFFFVKKGKYYFEQQFEPLSESYLKDKRTRGVLRQRVNKKSKYHKLGGQYKKQDNVPGKNANTYKGFNDRYQQPHEGRNKRTTWTINPISYPQAHFATYPPELIETPIKAGCPEFVCNKCGKPREKTYDREDTGWDGSKYGERVRAASGGLREGGTEKSTLGSAHGELTGKQILKGLSDCGCGAGFSPGVVLDPFLGSGTTIAVARYLGRIGLGFELNPEYVPLIRSRADLNQKDMGDFC